MLFYLVITAVVFQRLIELYISRRNEKWLLKNGAVEYGRNHYKYIVALHILFFVSMITEFEIKGRYSDFNIINYMFLVCFTILQIFRIWVIKSLGKYWNTRIYRIHGSEIVNSGPYKYFKHPNYIIVCGEIFILPMIFKLYFTAVLFTILNAVVLYVRIKAENEALLK
ncbi:MAG: hypothetical protein HGGPFJEG_01775 [Ignavibacteria bacterium]|nr:hypothetical protein [Ignavibacteria bacterium]